MDVSVVERDSVGVFRSGLICEVDPENGPRRNGSWVSEFFVFWGSCGSMVGLLLL